MTTTHPRLPMALPLVQGPFGGGLSTVALASAVSRRGGLGSFGAHLVEPDGIAGLVAELRAACDGPFAVNLWVSDHDPGGDAASPELLAALQQIFAPYFRELGEATPDPPAAFHPSFEDQAEALLAAAPPVFSFVFGVPRPAILDACRRRGILTIGAATTVAEALALDAAGVDAIVATGFEAGGHRPSFLSRAEDSLMGTMALMPLVVDRVRAPVIAAGGIVDGRGVRAARALGAAAVQLGTAFLACDESGASPGHRAALFGEGAHTTVLTRAFTGRLARGLRNRWTHEMADRLSALAPFPIQSWYVGQLKRAAVAAGRTDLVSLWGGQAAPNLRHHTADALITSLLPALATSEGTA